MALWTPETGGHNELYPVPQHVQRRNTLLANSNSASSLSKPMEELKLNPKEHKSGESLKIDHCKETDSKEHLHSLDAIGDDDLFSKDLISEDVLRRLPPAYTMRPLRHQDYDEGYLSTLSALTTVGDITKDQWLEQYRWMKQRCGEYFILVVCDDHGTCVGSGSVVIERKFIHKLGRVAHIEDIVVRKSEQGKKLGLLIIEALDHIARVNGCYKAILDCSEANEGFYLKCGYKRAGLEMAHYY